MNKKISLASSLAFLLIAVTLTFTVTMSVSWRMYNKAIESRADTQETYAKLSEVDQLVKQNFLFEISQSDLTDSLIEGYINGLGDPYAQYYSTEQVQAHTDSYNGDSVGLGVSYVSHPDTGYPYITVVHADSSAKDAGVQVGDQIVSIDGKDLLSEEGKALLSTVSKQKGKVFQVSILRDKRTMDFYLESTDYTVTSVLFDTIDDVGVIRILSFNTASVNQFKTAVASLQSSNVAGIVLDVRHNSGGSVAAARDMLDILLPEGTLYTAKYADGSTEKFTSDENAVDLPMVVLIDEHTASAAELFAGVVKDFFVGPLIGEQTYGKGIMQRTFSLSDGSELQITTAYLITPLGHQYHGTGILPSTEVILNDVAKSRFHLLSYTEDVQLQEGVKLLTNKQTQEPESSSSVSSSASSATSSNQSSAVSSAVSSTVSSTVSSETSSAAK